MSRTELTFAIPASFWRKMPKDEFTALIENDGWLNAAQCVRLWRLADRQSEPPIRLQIGFDMAELKRVFPPK